MGRALRLWSITVSYSAPNSLIGILKTTASPPALQLVYVLLTSCRQLIRLITRVANSKSIEILLLIDLWNRMQLKCSITKVFTYPLLSWCEISSPFRENDNVGLVEENSLEVFHQHVTWFLNQELSQWWWQNIIFLLIVSVRGIFIW